MKLDIVHAFGTGFIQADERHADVQLSQQIAGEKSIFPITIVPIDSRDYLKEIAGALQKNKEAIDQIILGAPSFAQVDEFMRYYANESEKGEWFPEKFEKLDLQIDNMVDAIIAKYAQNSLINQASKPIALVRKIKSKFFLVVTGNFCSENGKGEFTLKEFLIQDIKKSIADDNMNISVETLDLHLQRIIRGEGIGKYEALVRAYEHGGLV